MTRSMRAAVVEEIGHGFVIREEPIPDPGEGQVLVRMMASGICPTDTSLAHGSWSMRRPSVPYIAGHEGCGYVAAVGRGVAAHSEGDRVGVFWLNSTCGTCDYCACGRENLCLRQESTGYTMNGTHAEYCVVAADYAVPLPPGDFTDLAPFMCAGVTSYKAVRALDAREGDIVVVLGAGGTGHLAIQFARARGLKVVAVDVDNSKLELASDLGAFLCVNATKFPVNRVNRETGGANGVIVTAPSPSAFDQGMRMLRRGGTCVLVGVGADALSLSSFQAVINELDVRGTVSGTRRDLAEALALAGTGTVRAAVETFPLEMINQAVAHVAAGRVPGKAVVHFA